jgi:hypothetical protein
VVVKFTRQNRLKPVASTTGSTHVYSRGKSVDGFDGTR